MCITMESAQRRLFTKGTGDGGGLRFFHQKRQKIGGRFKTCRYICLLSLLSIQLLAVPFLSNGRGRRDDCCRAGG